MRIRIWINCGITRVINDTMSFSPTEWIEFYSIFIRVIIKHYYLQLCSIIKGVHIIFVNIQS